MRPILSVLPLVTLIGCDLDKKEKDLSIFEECEGRALGMEHGHIKDADITASSTFDFHSVGPHIGRARQDLKGGAWCPAQTISAGVREWLEINLHTDYRVTAAETMGRYGGGQGQEFAQAYQLEYWREGGWRLYTNTTGHQLLQGNVNTYMANRVELVPAIVASKLRFLPHSRHPRTVCMRVEVWGCPYTGPVASYSVVQGDQFSARPRLSLEDVYDGEEAGGQLLRGRGLLADGRVAPPPSFTEQGLVSAVGWVGWTNKKAPLELGFVFRSVQSVQAVTLATFSRPDMGIVSPAKMSVKIRNTRDQETGLQEAEVVETSSSEDGTVIIKYSLKNCVAKELSLFLHFGGKWIILSEVHFTSSIAEMETAHYADTDLHRPQQSEQAVEDTASVSDLKDDSHEEEKEAKDHKKELPQDEPPQESQEANTPRPKLQESDEPNSVVPIANGDSSQMYIGITIGILSMSVILLLFTIFFMLRKNKHRIFSKHSMFASSSKGPDVAATDIRLRLSPLVYSSAQQRRRISEYRDMDAEDRDLDLKQTIYDEPHRPLGLGSLHHANILKSKNKSCDVLCQYENFCHIREPGPMTNFGSTPLFNIFTVDQPSAGAGRPRAPPPTSYSTTNFKDSRYPAGGGCYDYSTPLRIDTHSKIAASESDVSDTFYAASDILNLKPESSASLNWRSFVPTSVSQASVGQGHY